MWDVKAGFSCPNMKEHGMQWFLHEVIEGQAKGIWHGTTYNNFLPWVRCILTWMTGTESAGELS